EAATPIESTATRPATISTLDIPFISSTSCFRRVHDDLRPRPGHQPCIPAAHGLATRTGANRVNACRREIIPSSDVTPTPGAYQLMCGVPARGRRYRQCGYRVRLLYDYLIHSAEPSATWTP